MYSSLSWSNTPSFDKLTGNGVLRRDKTVNRTKLRDAGDVLLFAPYRLGRGQSIRAVEKHFGGATRESKQNLPEWWLRLLPE